MEWSCFPVNSWNGFVWSQHAQPCLQACTTVQKWGLPVLEKIWTCPHIWKSLLDIKFWILSFLPLVIWKPYSIALLQPWLLLKNLMRIWYLFLCVWSVLLCKLWDVLPFIFLSVTKMCLNVGSLLTSPLWLFIFF